MACSSHHDVGFRPLNTFQLLNLVYHELVQILLVRGLHVGEDVGESPAGVSVLHAFQLAHRRHNIAHLSGAHIDQHIGSHLDSPSMGWPTPWATTNFTAASRSSKRRSLVMIVAL